MLPMVRMYITIAAGLFRMRKRDFILGATPAALVWVGIPSPWATPSAPM